ncbi:hypothetical protein C8J56DRAFT_418643 [Mycena floridula]|nr:hypothetical protein C8J56DRAFT_418643 [Mycena floridula]
MTSNGFGFVWLFSGGIQFRLLFTVSFTLHWTDSLDVWLNLGLGHWKPNETSTEKPQPLNPSFRCICEEVPVTDAHYRLSQLVGSTLALEYMRAGERHFFLISFSIHLLSLLHFPVSPSFLFISLSLSLSVSFHSFLLLL